MHGTITSQRIVVYEAPTVVELLDLADLEWQAAVDLGPAHKLSESDREYQRNCFDRAADYAARAASKVEA